MADQAGVDVAQGTDGRGVDEVLATARQMLQFARLGQRDFIEGGERRLPGLYNAVTSGRSVTFVLQHLRSRADGFDDWYGGVREQLRQDPVAKWFVEVRNRIEKEGTPGSLSTSMHLTSLDTATLWHSAPAGTNGLFIGDPLGRSGWMVQLADGTEQRVYFSLSPGVATVNLHLEDAPDGHPIQDLLEMWLTTLEKILAEAQELFGR